LEVKGPKRILLNFVEKLTYLMATRIYPNSLGLQTIIIRSKFVKASKLKIIGNGSSNGIDASKFSGLSLNPVQTQKIKEKLKISNDNIVFCFIGRLVKDKGINELIKAFQLLYLQNPLVRLILVGPFEDELDPLYPETIEVIHNHHGIHFEGFHDDVRPYLSICDVFVFPSYREGFPNVVMQAGAMGKPCIVTDINGCNEIIIEGINGLIIPPKNSNAILEAMQKMISQPEQRLRMENMARQMIVSRYDQKEVWKAILNEYQELKKEIGDSN
jgi:glycosyltransferase involved in cell wall biosynthesis